MAQIQRQSTKNAIYIYSGALIGLLSNILLGNYLTPEQNGVLGLFVAYGSLMGTFANLGFSFAGIRYFPEMRDPKTHNGGFLFASTKYGFISLFVLAVLFTLGINYWFVKEDYLFGRYFYVTLIVALGMMLFNVISPYMRFNFNTTTATLSKEFAQRILLIIVFLPFLFGWYSFSVYVLLYGLVFLSIPLVLGYYVHKKGYLYFGRQFGKLDPVFRSKFWKACLYGLATGVGASGLVYVDSIMLDRLLSTEATGIYVRNFYFATVILMASKAVQGISQTHISEAFSVNDLTKIDQIYRKSCLVQCVIGLLFFIGIWGNIDNIYRIIPIEFAAGRYVILLVGLGNLFNMMTGSNQLVISASPYYKVNTYTVYFLIGLAVILNLWWIPEYGLTGAAMATALSAVLFNTIRSVFIYVKYGFQPYGLKYIPLFAFAGIAWYLSTYIPRFDTLVFDIAIRSAVIAVLFGIPVYAFKISTDINRLVDKLTGTVLKRIGG